MLAAGALVAFPTETVYGLGADATNEDAVKRIFAVKGRPSNNPLILHFASLGSVYDYIEPPPGALGDRMRQRLSAVAMLWPGPLSVVLPRGNGNNRIADAVCAGGDTIAVRIPSHPVALELLRAFGKPVAAPSANPSNYISPTTAQHVVDSLGAAVAMVIDGGACAVGVESTVLSLVHEPPRILRPGAVTREILSTILGVPIAGPESEPHHPVDDSKSVLLSPGLLAKHYSPRTPVIFRPRYEQLLREGRCVATEKLGVIQFDQRPVPFSYQLVRSLSRSGNLEEIAATLFAALRELDAAGLDRIIIDTCEPVGMGEAIMDRLIRAVS